VNLIPEAGFDAYQVGPETDLAAVRAAVGDRLALFGNLDPVYTLPSASPTDVDAACKQAITSGGHDGGFILSTGGGPPRSGAPLGNLKAMIRAAAKYGAYPLST
jgi:uroporphyrinogen decarboxylase